MAVSNEDEVDSRLRALGSQNDKFAVRSSAVDEDVPGESSAGKNLSLLDISRTNVKSAVREVFNSYASRRPGDEVLIQEFVDDAFLSGVGISHTSIPGFTQLRVEYNIGSDTSAVTGGGVLPEVIHTRLFTDSNFESRKTPTIEWNQFFSIFELIQGLVGDYDLDVEFCFSKSRGWTIFQSRKLRESQYGVLQVQESEIDKELRDLFPTSDGATNGRPVYGAMPDWNPAELLGNTTPRLDSSLFSYLVTDSAWSQGRAELGYRDCRNNMKLSSAVGTRTYIDVRASARSLIPSNVSSEIADKTVVGMMEKLWRQPELHDRVEFDVYVAEFTARARGKLEDLGLMHFEIQDYLYSLRALTRRAIRSPLPTKEKFESDFKKSQSSVDDLSEPSNSQLSLALRSLLITERDIGWNEYSKTSRLAFMAHSILRDAEVVGELGQSEIDRFLGQINSPAKELKRTLRSGDEQRLLEIFGHLRPGNFNITSKRADFGDMLSNLRNHNSFYNSRTDNFVRGKFFELPQFETLNQLEISSKEFSDWALFAIENREWHKFFLAKGLDLVLSLISTLASRNGLSLDDVAHLTISELCMLEDFQSLDLDSLIRQRRALKFGLDRIDFPYLFYSFSSALTFENSIVQATYIGTDSRNCAPVEFDGNLASLKGKILLLESADPGYDFLLASDISGLITAYGGENSHMAVRCREIGLPAAIGIGKEEFGVLLKAKNIQISISQRKVIHS